MHALWSPGLTTIGGEQLTLVYKSRSLWVRMLRVAWLMSMYLSYGGSESAAAARFSTASMCNLHRELMHSPSMLNPTGSHLQVDLYSALLEKLFATGLAIQSWRRGIGAMRSSCPPAVPYKSLNVSAMDLVTS